jgi:ATP-binding cassette, subfamily G (WHITE), member 2, SNQ2
LWRNFGLIWAFFAFFVFLTALGMELQKPNKGGGAVTIYKRGQAPKSVENAIESGGKAKDEETGKKGYNVGVKDLSYNDEKRAEKGIARNEAIFTFQNVNYTIPYQGGERNLLQNVQGFVKPGKLTALMVWSNICL